MDVLRFEDECSLFTIHLVCRVDEATNPATIITSSTTKVNTSDSPSSFINTSGNSPSDLNQPSTSQQPDGIRNRRLPQQQQLQDSYGLQQQLYATTTSQQLSYDEEARQLMSLRDMLHGLAPGQAGGGAAVQYTPEQYTQIQEMYSQYMSLYAQYMHSHQTPSAAHEAVANTAVAAPMAAAAAAENVNVAAVGPAAAAAVPAGAAVAAAAEEGGDEEGGQNNDLLDYAYAGVRVLIMLCVMYVHSSFFRLLFVVGGMLLAYFLQNRNRHPQQQQQNLPQEVNNNQEGHQQDRQQQQPANNSEDEQDGEEGEGETMAEPKPNLLMVTWTFVSSLITSIIPEQPQMAA